MTALALLRERVLVIAVKLVDAVSEVVVLASLPSARKYSREALARPENAADPNPLDPSCVL